MVIWTLKLLEQKWNTALQMDIKLGGIELSVLKEALLQAKRGKRTYFKLMENAATDIVPSDALPLVEQFAIDPSKVMVIIGKSRSNNKRNYWKILSSIDLDKDSGNVKKWREKQNVLDACEHIKTISNNAVSKKESKNKFWKLYQENEMLIGKVEKIVDFGAFILLPKGGEGLLHIQKF